MIIILMIILIAVFLVMGIIFHNPSLIGIAVGLAIMLIVALWIIRDIKKIL